jgi:hypothetical protein
VVVLIELIILAGWAASAAAASWFVWRLAYAQGREDAGRGACCKGHGHEEPEIPMPTPDQWDEFLSRVLAESRGQRPGLS